MREELSQIEGKIVTDLCTLLTNFVAADASLLDNLVGEGFPNLRTNNRLPSHLLQQIHQCIQVDGPKLASLSEV